MTRAEVVLPKCGDCIHFKTTYMSGEEVGFIVEKISGPDGRKLLKTIKMGLCKTNGGLIFGVRSAKAECSQPAGIFSPKTSIPKTVSK